MEGLMTNFWSIVADFKRKPYELLDFALNQFDRDYLEFNANIHELESSLQGFINQSFETINSTEQALDPSSTLRSLHRPLPPLPTLLPPTRPSISSSSCTSSCTVTLSRTISTPSSW